MKKFSITAACAITAENATGGPGTIEMDAYNGGPLMMNGWDYPAVCELSSITAAADLIPARIGHGQDEVDDVLGQIGITVGKTVFAKGIVTSESERALNIKKMAKNGHKFQASIGGDPGRMVFIPAGDTLAMNDRTFDGPIYACYNTILGEISVVSLGADTTTATRIAATAAKGLPKMKATFATWLEARGFVEADLKELAKTTLKASYDSDSDDMTDEEKAEKKKKDDAEAKAEAARKDTAIKAAHKDAMNDPMVLRAQQHSRIAAIEEKAKGHSDIIASALTGNWDDARIASEIELKDLRAGRARSNAPAMHIHGKHVTDMGKVIEASCLMAGGISADRLLKSHGEAHVEAASTEYRGIGIRDMFRLFAEASGVRLPMFSGTGADFIEAAFAATFGYPGQSVRAAGGFSTLSLPGILSNVAHKLLLEGYNNVEQTWRAISKRGSLQDFKPHNRFRLTNDMSFKPLSTAGELRHGALGEQAYQITGDTQGIMFNLDRKLIINDDMSAFSDIPKAIGRGAGLAINRDFWTLFLSNPANTTAYGGTASGNFFGTGNANYLSGATVGTNDSRLNVEGLSRAWTKILQQTDPGGFPMGVEPSILLVPASLRYTAEGLMLSRILVSSVSTGATNNNLQPSENPLAGKFQVNASAYLDNASFVGNSTTAWYLLLNPEAGYPCIEAAFLNGMEQPTVERAEADFSTLGIRFRSWIDFGLALEEPRGGVMSAGA